MTANAGDAGDAELEAQNAYLERVSRAFQYRNEVLTPATQLYDRTNSTRAWEAYNAAVDEFSRLIDEATAIAPPKAL